MKKLNANLFIETETQKRIDLTYDPEFIEESIKVAKKLGISDKDFNKNKFIILLYFANVVCEFHNEYTEKSIFERTTKRLWHKSILE
jgi:hypothetical protein